MVGFGGGGSCITKYKSDIALVVVLFDSPTKRFHGGPSEVPHFSEFSFVRPIISHFAQTFLEHGLSGKVIFRSHIAVPV
jgi:hypothetical protein